MTKIIEALQQARKAKNISQDALSRVLGLPQSHLSKIESGKTDPRLSSVEALAHALEMEVVLVPKRYIPAIRAITQGKPLDQSPWQPDEDFEDE